MAGPLPGTGKMSLRSHSGCHSELFNAPNCIKSNRARYFKLTTLHVPAFRSELRPNGFEAGMLANSRPLFKCCLSFIRGKMLQVDRAVWVETMYICQPPNHLLRKLTYFSTNMDATLSTTIYAAIISGVHFTMYG